MWELHAPAEPSHAAVNWKLLSLVSKRATVGGMAAWLLLAAQTIASSHGVPCFGANTVPQLTPNS